MPVCVTADGVYASFATPTAPVTFVDAINTLYLSLGYIDDPIIAVCADLDDDGDVDFVDFVNVLYLQLGLRDVPEHLFVTPPPPSPPPPPLPPVDDRVRDLRPDLVQGWTMTANDGPVKSTWHVNNATGAVRISDRQGAHYLPGTYSHYRLSSRITWSSDTPRREGGLYVAAAPWSEWNGFQRYFDSGALYRRGTRCRLDQSKYVYRTANRNTVRHDDLVRELFAADGDTVRLSRSYASGSATGFYGVCFCDAGVCWDHIQLQVLDNGLVPGFEIDLPSINVNSIGLAATAVTDSHELAFSTCASGGVRARAGEPLAPFYTWTDGQIDYSLLHQTSLVGHLRRTEDGRCVLADADLGDAEEFTVHLCGDRLVVHHGPPHARRVVADLKDLLMVDGVTPVTSGQIAFQTEGGGIYNVDRLDIIEYDTKETCLRALGEA